MRNRRTMNRMHRCLIVLFRERRSDVGRYVRAERIVYVSLFSAFRSPVGCRFSKISFASKHRSHNKEPVLPSFLAFSFSIFPESNGKSGGIQLFSHFYKVTNTALHRSFTASITFLFCCRPLSSALTRLRAKKEFSEFRSLAFFCSFRNQQHILFFFRIPTDIWILKLARDGNHQSN